MSSETGLIGTNLGIRLPVFVKYKRYVYSFLIFYYRDFMRTCAQQKGVLSWRVYLGINGMGVSVQSAVRPAMNNTIGIFAKENVSVAGKPKTKDIIGIYAKGYVYFAERHRLNNIVGKVVNAPVAARPATNNTNGMVVDVFVVMRTILNITVGTVAK